MIWVSILILYLLVGFMFEMPSDWKWHRKVFHHVLWLPILLWLIYIFNFSK